MREFTKDVKRLVHMKAADPGLPPAAFVITVGPKGIKVRRKGESPETGKALTWRTVIGMTCIHAKV